MQETLILFPEWELVPVVSTDDKREVLIGMMRDEVVQGINGVRGPWQTKLHIRRFQVIKR